MPKTHKKQLIVSAVGVLGIILFILTTNPLSISVVLLLFLPVLIAITSFTLTKLTLECFTGLTNTKVRILSLMVTTGPVLLVMLGSLGQLGLQDFTLASLLIGGLVWYTKQLRIVQPQSSIIE